MGGKHKKREIACVVGSREEQSSPESVSHSLLINEISLGKPFLVCLLCQECGRPAFHGPTDDGLIAAFAFWKRSETRTHKNGGHTRATYCVGDHPKGRPPLGAYPVPTYSIRLGRITECDDAAYFSADWTGVLQAMSYVAGSGNVDSVAKPTSLATSQHTFNLKVTRLLNPRSPVPAIGAEFELSPYVADVVQGDTKIKPLDVDDDGENPIPYNWFHKLARMLSCKRLPCRRLSYPTRRLSDRAWVYPP